MEKNKENVVEVQPGMTVEEIKALFFDANALKEPGYKVYQLNSDGYRYYYRYESDGNIKFYPSVTTMLKAVMPTSPFLLEWMMKNGSEGSIEKRDLAAAYGTFMHAQFERLLIERCYDFDAVPGVLMEYMQKENLPDKFYNENLTKIRKDVLAFAQFVKDYNVRPMAVEIGLVHPELNYAGCIDMPCVMTDPKKGETFAAIVDFKSGRKGFFEEHELQLHLYAAMWNYNFPDVPIKRLFNFSPKDWRGAKPTYNLKEQTDSVNAHKLPHLLALAAIEDEKRDNTLTVVQGVYMLDEGKIEDNIVTLSLAELITSKRDQIETPDAPANAPGITQEEIKSAEEALGIRNKADEPQESPRKRTKASAPKNVSSDGKKADTGQKSENLPKSEPTPEQIAEFMAKDELLNTEIEL